MKPPAVTEGCTGVEPNEGGAHHLPQQRGASFTRVSFESHPNAHK